jgi:hypothetical protein
MKMNEEDLRPFENAKATVWVDLKQKKAFHYKGKVIRVTNSALTLHDDQTGELMSWPLGAILAITREAAP